MLKQKCGTLLIAVAAVILSTSAAVADGNPDDRSYLPPQAAESQGQAAPQANDRLSGARYGTPHRYARRHYAHYRTRRHYAHWNTRRYYASRGWSPGGFFGLFR